MRRNLLDENRAHVVFASGRRRRLAAWSPTCRRLAAWGGCLAVFLLVSLAGVGVRGQEDEDDEEQANAQAQPQFEVAVENFDQWIFNSQPGGNALDRLETLLMLQTQFLDRACQLSAPQKKKLELAGYGDIKRFVDRMEEVREKFLLVRKDQEKFNEIWQEIHPLQTTLSAGLFGKESIFCKTLRSTLTPEQTVSYERVDRDRRLFRYRAKIELTLTNLQSTVTLSDEQHEQLVALVLAETPPPLQFGQYDYYVVIVALSRIPDEKLRTILDATQLATLRQHLRQGQGMEQFLKQNGYLDSDGDQPAEKNPEVRR